MTQPPVAPQPPVALNQSSQFAVPPVYQAPQEPLEEGVERSKQLNDHRAALESAAMYEDILVEQDQTDVHESQAAYQQYMQARTEPVRPTEPIVDATTETALDAQ